jgi:hypothetical protein
VSLGSSDTLRDDFKREFEFCHFVLGLSVEQAYSQVDWHFFESKVGCEGNAFFVGIDIECSDLGQAGLVIQN